MSHLRQITNDLYWVGCNDRRLNLFENAFPIPDGVSYNAYLLMDEKTALLDTVDSRAGEGFLDSLAEGLNGRALDYLIISHMEPDHCGMLAALSQLYPDVTVVGNDKTFAMLQAFFGDRALFGNTLTVGEGSELKLGAHTLQFALAPMVHWPEVMVAFDQADGTLFSADAFGTFGAIDGCLFADEADFNGPWLSEMRRYFTNIVGKYGAPTQALLKKAAALPIQRICPLHGPIWRERLDWLMEKHRLWSACQPESDGVLVAYASIYGHTAAAAEALAEALRLAGAKEVRVFDVSVTHPSYILSETFRLRRWAFLSVTYNAGLFPAMETLLLDLKAHSLKNRRVALVENGSWAAVAGKLMRGCLEGMKDVTVVEPMVSLRSAMKPEQAAALKTLAQALMAEN